MIIQISFTTFARYFFIFRKYAFLKYPSGIIYENNQFKTGASVGD